MLVMAIEAAYQLTDKARSVDGFNIKDATFATALIIPLKPESIETEFYMSPLKDTSAKDSSWFQFKLCTYDQGQWFENCNGSIQIVYQADMLVAGKNIGEKVLYNEQIFESGIQACRRPIDEAYIYKRLLESGFDYGPTFKNLYNLSCNESGEAIANVKKLHRDFSVDKQPHTIHPTTLDGIFQLNLVGICRGGKDHLPILVPTRVQKMWISKSDLNENSQGSLKVYTKSAYKGYRGSESSIYVMNEMNGQICMKVDGFEATIVSNNDKSTESRFTDEHICYSMDWKADIDLLSSEQILNYCQEPSRTESVPEPVAFYEELDFALLSYISKALQSISGLETENISFEFRKYIFWMSHQVERLGQSQAWIQFLQNPEYHNTLIMRIESSCMEGKFYITVGRNLVQILLGELNSLDLFFFNDLVACYYEEMFEKIKCIKMLARYLDAMAHKDPTLKILEVGAETGGMTDHVLKALAKNEDNSETLKFARYDYTDISPSFFEKAKIRFETYS